MRVSARSARQKAPPLQNLPVDSKTKRRAAAEIRGFACGLALALGTGTGEPSAFMLTAIATSAPTPPAVPDAAPQDSAGDASRFLEALKSHTDTHTRHGKTTANDSDAKAAAKAAAAAKDLKTADAKLVPLEVKPDARDSHLTIRTARGDGVTAIASGAERKTSDAKTGAAMHRDSLKAESASVLATTLLAAVTSSGDVNAATPKPTPAPVPKDSEGDEVSVSAKGKPQRSANARREAAENARSAKAEPASLRTGAKAEDSSATDATTAHPVETHPAPAGKPTEATSLPAATAAIVHPDTEMNSAGGVPSTQVVETRIPLAREAVPQAGIAAPSLMMRVHTKDGSTRAIEIRLDPPGLGPVNVKLETDSEGRLSAVLSTEKSEAFELLKRESGALEAALREAGVDLGKDGVSFSLSDGGNAGSAPEERNAAYDGATTRRNASLEDVVAQPEAHGPAWRDGVIDISV